MSFENKTIDPNAPRIFELQMTQAQCMALSRILPQGYTLELVVRPKKESSHKPSKKVFTNEGAAVKINSQGLAHPPAPTRTHSRPPVQAQLPPVQLQTQQYIQPLHIPHDPIPTLQHSDSATKRVLRDNKKKPQTYLEEKFPETVAVPTTSSKSMKPMNEGAKKCLNLLQRLKKHNCVGPFLQPVDVEGLGLWDYYDIVPEPMDLGTVEKKLKNGDYSSVDEFGTDIRKIWSNAMAYNTEGSAIYNMTLKISQYFERIFKEIEDVPFNDKVFELEKKVKMLTQQIASLNKPETLSAKKVSGSGPRFAKSPSSIEEPMTIQEKKVLCDHIKRLPPESLRGVWEIVSRSIPNTQNNKEELVFDIDALPVKVTRELEKFVKSKIGVTNKATNKNKKDAPTAKPPVMDAQYYAQNFRPEINGTKYIAPQQNLMPSDSTQAFKKDDDAESKSSDSSFISDSESGSDDERKHKPKPAQNYLLKQQDLANFQAGGHGSMLNSFIVK